MQDLDSSMTIEIFTMELFHQVTGSWTGRGMATQVLLNRLEQAAARGNTVFVRHNPGWTYFEYMEVHQDVLNEEYVIKFVMNHENWNKGQVEAQIIRSSQSR